MHIIIIYNEPLPSRYHDLGEQVAIASVLESVNGVQAELLAQGHTVELLGLVPPLEEAITKLQSLNFDLLFNFFEGFDGDSGTECQFADALTTLDYKFTGASAETIKLCLDKAKTKLILEKSGIATAPYQILDKNNRSLTIPFPVILKPCLEDASHGLSESSVVYNLEAFETQLSALTERYDGPILAEKFLVGREFNAAVLGDKPRVLPISEIIYTDTMPGPKILTYAAKWQPEDPAYYSSLPKCPADVSEEMASKIRSLVLDSYRAVGSPAYARVDLRCDEAENIYVLEVNPNPDFSPKAGLALQAKTAGISYGELVKIIVDLAKGEQQC